MQVTTTLHVTGEIHGDLWMPGCHAWKPINARILITRDACRRGEALSVRDALADLLNDGDFQSCLFAPDTMFALIREYRLPRGTVRDGESRLQLTAGSVMRRARSFEPGPEWINECGSSHDDGDDDGNE